MIYYSEEIKKVSKYSGFTLVELLVVIAMLGVLAVVVLSLLAPRFQIERAKERTVLSNVTNVCLGIMACKTSYASIDSNLCDEWSEIAKNKLQDTDDTTYVLRDDNDRAINDDGYVSIVGTVNGCSIECRVMNDYSSWGTPPTRSGGVVLSGDCAK